MILRLRLRVLNANTFAASDGARLLGWQDEKKRGIRFVATAFVVVAANKGPWW